MVVAREQESCTYQVFLSFRGEETRKNFTGHLYTALVQAGFCTFRDDDEIKKGEDIKSELKKAIQQSRISIIVFSKGYASSRWCLDELVMMIERKRISGHVIFPIFYNVEPTQIRKQLESIGDTLAKYHDEFDLEADCERRKELMDKLKRWREALSEAVDLAGMELKNHANGDESKFIKEVVNSIQDILNHKVLNVARHLVSIHSRTRKINLWLQDESSDFSIMVMYGMGGIGKTTIAKYVFNQNFDRFAGSSFLANIRETSEDPNGLVRLQSQLLSDICNRKIMIHNTDAGTIKIQESICCKRVLLVLDDVDHDDHLNAIIGMRNSFFPGSKIIITTRRESLLKPYDVYAIHKVENLAYNESIELFSLNAFGQKLPTEGYMELTTRIVDRCKGLPLALQVLGSSLSGKSVDIWSSQLKKLETFADSHIVMKLKISFDCLPDEDVKNIFLHLACFFAGQQKDSTVKVLDACDFYTAVGIEHIVDRCLLEVDCGKLKMHQLILDMGREIVRQESSEAGKRSRLWHPNDCFSVLRDKTGTEKIEGLVFDMQKFMKDKPMRSNFSVKKGKKFPVEDFGDSLSTWRNHLKRVFLRHPNKSFINSKDMFFETDTFARMQQLKLLQLNYVNLGGSYKEFPKKLRWLCWHGFNLKSVPNDLSLERLVCLDMQYSSLKQVWKGNKFLPALKILNLSHSIWLAKTPDFSGAQNLERLILEGCISLVEVCESIGYVEGLALLNLKDCKSLRKLPRDISRLIFLEELIISGCTSLGEFPTGMRNMESLKVIQAESLGTSALFSPIRRVKQWAFLPQSLINLSLRGCKLYDDSFPEDLTNLSSLKELNLSETLIQTLPDCFRALGMLNTLRLNDCPQLQSVIGLPKNVKIVSAVYNKRLERVETTPNLCNLNCEGCENLVDVEGCYKSVPINNVDKRVLKNLGLLDLQSTLRGNAKQDTFDYIRFRYEFGIFSTIFQGNEVPRCFSYKNRDSRSISFTVPSLPDNLHIRGLNVCFLYDTIFPDVYWYPCTKVVNKTKGVSWIYKPKYSTFPFCYNGGNLLMSCHWKLGNLLKGGDFVTFSVEDCFIILVKELGIKVVYDEDDEEQEENEGKKETTNWNSTPYLSWTNRNVFELSDFHEKGTSYFFGEEILFSEDFYNYADANGFADPNKAEKIVKWHNRLLQ